MVNLRTIDEILGSLNPAQKETVQNIRALIKEAVPETVELVKQGKIVYKLCDNDFVCRRGIGQTRVFFHSRISPITQVY